MSPGRNKTKCSLHLVNNVAKTTRLLENFGRTKQSEGNWPSTFKVEGKTNRCDPKICENETERSEIFFILQDRSKTNIFDSNCVGGKKRKKTNLRFFWNKAKKNEYNRPATIEDLPLLLVTSFM